MTRIKLAMSSSTRLKEAIRQEISFDRPDVQSGAEHAVELIKSLLAIDPTLIEDLAPGMRLVRRPMTAKERGRMAIPAMNAARRAYHEEMVLALAPVVGDVRRLKPDANGHEIAIELNRTAYGPSKTRKEWTYADVRRLLKELGLDHEPNAT
ncbi:hypothetical protein [Shinella zoogloeoides]|uniref:hypothetical protein n=1 Tax=Shinella zoogloeoides TaxID=352475 RepID=UPI00273FD55E|nr:hypothetical protein [Shinella zoogloeoides]WLR90931.1 hypothetical protein Q9316_00710 [Shinella zoogloeoides]